MIHISSNYTKERLTVLLKDVNSKQTLIHIYIYIYIFVVLSLSEYGSIFFSDSQLVRSTVSTLSQGVVWASQVRLTISEFLVTKTT
jgi:hypothetical protein